MNSKPGELCCV